MAETTFDPGPQCAQELDAHDELAPFRQAFRIAEPDLIYLDGNSLGRLPQAVVGRMRRAVEEEWGQELVRGWNRGWYEAPARVGDKIGQLLGAAPGQVIVTDSTSVNLYKLLIAALQARPEGTQVISDTLNFPSDLYIIQGAIHLLGERHRLHLVPSIDDIHADEAGLLAALNEKTALVTLSHVAFKSGYLYDTARLTAEAHQAGALVLWDLSHSAGAVPIELDAWDVDLAVGCTYKYLNGGPGAPAYLYVNRRLQEQLRSPIWGWFGQCRPFDFDLQYEPAEGVARFLAGTPPMLSLLAMEAALEPLLQAGMERIRRRSILLTEYLVYLFDQHLAPLGFALGSPRDPVRRGSHVSIRHPEGYRINRALIEELGVLPDFRPPDNIRLGLSPLYTSFSEVYEAVQRLRRAVEEKRYLRYPEARLPVT